MLWLTGIDSKEARFQSIHKCNNREFIHPHLRSWHTYPNIAALPLLENKTELSTFSIFSVSLDLYSYVNK